MIDPLALAFLRTSAAEAEFFRALQGRPSEMSAGDREDYTILQSARIRAHRRWIEVACPIEETP